MRFFALTFKKLRVLFGGRLVLLPVALAVFALVFAAAGSAFTRERNTEVKLAAVDFCGGELSSALIGAVSEAPGFEVILCPDMRSAEDALLSGSAEAILTLDKAFDAGLIAGSSGLIDVITAPGSVSAELIRETAAGKLIALRSRQVVLGSLASDGIDASRFDSFAAEFDPPSIYKIVSVNGAGAESAVFGKGFAGYEGLAGLALLLLAMTLSRRLSMEGSRLVSLRLSALPGGSALAFSTDAAALFISSLIPAAAVFCFAPNRSAETAVGLFAYCALITGVCLAVISAAGSGRVDMLSPAVAVFTSLLGGCFADLGSLSPVLRAVSYLTPQGQFTALSRGAWGFLPLMLAETALLLFAAAALQKKSLQSHAG